jgi:hypothetical protein
MKGSYSGEIWNIIGGEKQFGWQVEYYRDVYSKINFAYLQTYYAKNKEWRKMLKKVIMDHTGAYGVRFNVDPEDYNSENYGYIDHGSNATEDENTEMFENENTLNKFLFNPKSYICNDNDNH